MNSRTALAGAAAIAAASAALLAQPAAAATALNGQLNASATAQTHGLAVVNDQQSQNWTAAPATLNVAVEADARALYRDSNDTVSVFGTAQATWASADSGSVDFTNYGWNVNVRDPAVLENLIDLQASMPGNGVDWTYTFQATSTGTFTMDYNVTATGDTFNLEGWNIYFQGALVGPDLTNPQFYADPTTSGVVTETVLAGSTYTVSLFNDANGAGCCAQAFAGSMDGTFDWNITEGGGVPEPASWALMLVGFGGLGAVLRARRRPAAVLA
jgi:hypothetical protein